jgi:hypothetical protein
MMMFLVRLKVDKLVRWWARRERWKGVGEVVRGNGNERGIILGIGKVRLRRGRSSFGEGEWEGRYRRDELDPSGGV